MSKQPHKRLRSLTGYFRGWGDDRPLHAYIQLAMLDGDRLVKVAKSLRPHIQDWQPGIYLTLLAQETSSRDSGECKIKVKQVLTTQPRDPDRQVLVGLASAPPIAPPSRASHGVVVPTKIQICQGSSCRKRGGEKICQMMQAYLNGSELGERVEIETVKCLHQCKAAPHAIVTSPAGATLPGKTHYRQVQSSQVQAILAQHLPIALIPAQGGTSALDTISTYLQQQIAIAIAH
ncbi:(2Fe-2S) ferredoxin domain-containing protein [Chamaesiphon sp.]|uniref:(2Fe-2S) ferredoxin domain-containing protein n=1 Tax=Chamaesiphon sp. TaxID=2814140 RepID=UPI003593DCB4